MKLRVLTGLVIGAISLTAVLVFSPELSSLVFALVCLGALVEFVAIVRQVLPSAPLRSLYLWVPALTLVFFFFLQRADALLSAMELLCLLTALLFGVVVCVLFGGTAMKDAIGALGILTFAIPYFVLPQIAYFWLMHLDRWLVVLLLAVVALGDSFAYFIGRAWGRHKMAPVISPNKSWEGLAAGLLASLLAAAVWSWLRLGHVDHRYLIAAAATALAGVLGDLIESLVKRGAGVKDSSGILPGHGGLYDRIDALLLAAPVFVGALYFLGLASPAT